MAKLKAKTPEGGPARNGELGFDFTGESWSSVPVDGIAFIITVDGNGKFLMTSTLLELGRKYDTLRDAIEAAAKLWREKGQPHAEVWSLVATLRESHEKLEARVCDLEALLSKLAERVDDHNAAIYSLQNYADKK